MRFRFRDSAVTVLAVLIFALCLGSAPVKASAAVTGPNVLQASLLYRVPVTTSIPAIPVPALSARAGHLRHLRHLDHLRHLKIQHLHQGPVVLTAQQTASTSSSHLGGTLGCAGLEALWEAAGGSPGAAFLAAEIAMAESGGNQYALSPTSDYGYWQINSSHGPAMATFNAMRNAEAAIAISADGTSWGAWTTYTSGAYAGRC